MSAHHILDWWFIRHAEIVDMDAQGNPTKGIFIGQMDVDCKAPKTEQLTWLMAQLPQCDMLVTSPLKRAKQTAKFLTAQGLSVAKQHVEPAFAEQDFGNWQGMDYQAHYEEFPEFWDNIADNRPPNGISFADLQQNVAQAMQSYYHQQDYQNLLVVAHAGSIRAALASCAGKNLNAALNYQIDHLSLTHLTMQQTSDGYDLQAIHINMGADNE